MSMPITRRAATLAACGLISLAALGPAAHAGDDDSIKAALVAQQSKRVYVRLHSGEELAGRVDAVGKDTLKLAELQGRDFYDAVIRLDRIEAVIVKAR